ncbi:MAG TPA: hypothetical protein PK079_25880 [Leptospiraceae bacterium]|nr:hypothetical protein [Leptospiraceae bacterium]HNC59935.1 hypothetical protein [Leptospiraceae bacterium]HNE56620.1 hypothetical protein [Leptospiraceae bacterium]HNF57576.1 hypothetical protein [Leptospiraceae bacterium]HNM92118.1 hypothetical protein [Leptospiraceae bacterium]
MTITGETIIKGLLYYILKSRAAVGEIHHWASGDYKKDVHGWKKIKKDIQKHLESEYSKHAQKHGDTDTQYFNRDTNLNALNTRLQLLQKNPEKFKNQIEETKKYIANLSRGKSRIRNFKPKNIDQYKSELKEKLSSMYKDFVTKQAESVYSTKIEKINKKLEPLREKIKEIESKINSKQSEYDKLPEDLDDTTILDEIDELDSDKESIQEDIDELKNEIDLLNEYKQETIDSKVSDYEYELEQNLDDIEADSSSSVLDKYVESKEAEIKEAMRNKIIPKEKSLEYETNPASIKEINIQHAKRTKELSDRVKKILSRLNKGKK